MARLVRRAHPCIIYKEKDITEEILPYLQKVESIDNLEGQLDEIRLTFRNEKNLFLTPKWSFEKKDKISFGIKTFYWENSSEGEQYRKIGEYYIDDRKYNRNNATLKGISAPLIAKNTPNSKIWANISLEKLGEEIANKYELKYAFKADENIILEEVRQENETDFSLLNKIAKDEGVKLKITHNSLILFDEDRLVEKEPILILDLNKVIDFQIRDKSNDVYDSAEVGYYDPMERKEKKVIISWSEIIGEEKNEDPEKILKVKGRSRSNNLQKYAEKQLIAANKREIEIEITIVGYLNAYAGATIMLINSGIFNGKYVITKVNQSIPNFVTKLSTYQLKEKKDDVNTEGSDRNNS